MEVAGQSLWCSTDNSVFTANSSRLWGHTSIIQHCALEGGETLFTSILWLPSLLLMHLNWEGHGGEVHGNMSYKCRQSLTLVMKGSSVCRLFQIVRSVVWNYHFKSFCQYLAAVVNSSNNNWVLLTFSVINNWRFRFKRLRNLSRGFPCVSWQTRLHLRS